MPARWISALAVALAVIALLLFAGSLRDGWPHPAYLLMMIAAGSVFGLGAAARERKRPFWPLAGWITLAVIARQIFYEDAAMLSWRSAQHHSALVLSAITPILYLMWRSRGKTASESEGPPPSPSLPTGTRRGRGPAGRR